MRLLNGLETDRIRILTENGVELTLLEPTATGLNKAILDATGPVRSFLLRQSIHDYETQGQGQSNKVKNAARLIGSEIAVRSEASLYRPSTKMGDPRIWFSGLKTYADANNILALFVYNQEICVLNITTIDVSRLLESPESNPLKEIVTELSHASNIIAYELLGLLYKIAAQGPVPAMLEADTAIGRTLETLLGIQINPFQQPDYKGIELKSYRSGRGNRKSLFAQVPDWTLSKLKSSAEILDNFGYGRGEDTKLYCTVSSVTRNSQGLMLRVDNKLSQLLENSDNSVIGDFVVWRLRTLHDRLLQKHNETFWVGADTVHIDGREHFHFKTVEHTRKPIVSQFDILLEQGIITVDHLIKRVPSGKVVEKGPLFKIKPNAINLLFPPSKTYSLV